jgi:hypothetical protein
MNMYKIFDFVFKVITFGMMKKFNAKSNYIPFDKRCGGCDLRGYSNGYGHGDGHGNGYGYGAGIGDGYNYGDGNVGIFCGGYSSSNGYGVGFSMGGGHGNGYGDGYGRFVRDGIDYDYGSLE